MKKTLYPMLILFGLVMAACGSSPLSPLGDEPIATRIPPTSTTWWGGVEAEPTDAPEPTATRRPTDAPEPTDVPEPTSTDAPELTDGETYVMVDERHVEIYTADGDKVAEVESSVDFPTEWLNGREGILYLFQSGINRSATLRITLYLGGAFAADGDAFTIDGVEYGVKNDADDAIVFADSPGEYVITGSSFGIAFGSYRAGDDKAGYVLADRRAATGHDGRPEWWLDPNGDPVCINCD